MCSCQGNIAVWRVLVLLFTDDPGAPEFSETPDALFDKPG
jgi:hypothetical protein